GVELDAGARAALIAAGGVVVQVMHRGQRLHRIEDDGWEDLDGTFMPGVVRFGWAAVIRPDKTVLHEGPVADSTRLVLESLQLLGARTALSSLSDHIAQPIS
ncbi:3-(3-hydroxyphenyl)propionate hydroxylase, partial [Burkholderia cenocepacia]|nr:3-(3-hydroxyphenyl)propionate hydroxylase [Burkholderia cenocepacia]